MVCEAADGTVRGRTEGAGRGRSQCGLSGRGRTRQADRPLDGGARAELAEVAAAAFLAVRPGNKELGPNPLRHLDDRLPVFFKPFLWLLDRDPLTGLEVVVGEAERIEAEDLAGGERVDPELQVPLQVRGPLRRARFVIDDLIA